MAFQAVPHLLVTFTGQQYIFSRTHILFICMALRAFKKMFRTFVANISHHIPIVMRKKICTLLTLIFLPMIIYSQSYSALWRQAESAQKRDLPKDELAVLRKISDKAAKEQRWGHLLKAEMRAAGVTMELSPDSVSAVVKRLSQLDAQAHSEPLHAIYNLLLGYVYAHSDSFCDNQQAQADTFFTRALAHPEVLAKEKAGGYNPFVTNGVDSRYFLDDLLHVIGFTAQRYEPLYHFYKADGNRSAAMFSALMRLRQLRPDEMQVINKSAWICRLDSLINAYADLTVTGEAAIERYNCMAEQTTATAEEKITYINMALDRWGGWKRMNELRQAYRELTAPNFEVEAASRVITSGDALTLKADELRGLKNLTLSIYPVKLDGSTTLDASRESEYKKIKPLLGKVAQSQTHKYMGKKPYELFDDEFKFQPLPVGVYMIEASSTPATSTLRSMLFVSDVRTLCLPLPNDSLRYVVVNARSGQPIAGAKLLLTLNGWVNGKRKLHTETFTTGANGEYLYAAKKNSKPTDVRATAAGDNYCPSESFYNNYYYTEAKGKIQQAIVMTDRAIYRPGQQVKAAAVVYQTTNGTDQKALAGHKTKFVLRDANYEVVGEQEVVTDDFGTAAATFTLPAQTLSGRFHLECDGQSHDFRVEEYKRPTFEATFPEIKSSYHEGDTLVVRATARSYSGMPVQGAKVKYTVERTRAWWWAGYLRYWNMGYVATTSNSELLAEIETTTDDDGTFTVEVPLNVPATRYPMFYNFVVKADVTDLAGETHQATLTVPLGNRTTALDIDISDEVLREKPQPFAITLRNAAGADIEAEASYRIDGGEWLSAKTNTPIDLPTKQLSCGRHTLEAKQDTLAVSRQFVVFGLDDKVPAVETHDWCYVSDDQFAEDGSPVTVQVGASDEKVHVVYALFAGEKQIEGGAFDLSNALWNRKISYQKEYGSGLRLVFAWMKNGVAYTHEADIKRPLPKKDLSLKWETFRDRLTPGQQETWTLRIAGPEGKPVPVQLLAALYDKSLDQIAPQQWRFNPYLSLSLPSTSWQAGSWGGIYARGAKNPGSLMVPDLDWSHIDQNLLSGAYHHTIRYMGASRRFLASARPMVMNKMAAGVMADMVMEEKSTLTPSESAKESAQQEPLRQNFSETAFFYPQLLADSTGLVTIRFTLPETLTTWRFAGVAHTADLCRGLLQADAVASKDVMLQPNVPRFVRNGDRATLSARIFNAGKQKAEGKATLTLLDPETEKTVMTQAVRVSIDAGQTANVEFSFTPDDKYALLIARMKVEGANFSDGEQHYLPVLPNAEPVTVTLPFTQTKAGTAKIDLDQLVPKGAGEALVSVEYTQNPAWMVVQALPSLAESNSMNAISQAAVLYANTLGSHLMNGNERIKNVLNQWRNEAGETTSFTSQLAKDPELKDLLLNETPWVMEAKDEESMRRQLFDFFDDNTLANRRTQALDKLSELQNYDGSWSWWKGMDGSTYITVSVAEMLVRLNHLAGPQSETKELLSHAFDFMGRSFVKEVAEMKKLSAKQHFPSMCALQWLYLCAVDGRKLPADVAEANNYLIGLLKKERKHQSIYEKAMTAIVLHSKEYAESLKQHTVSKAGMGRYYDTPRAGYSWFDYRIPTQVMAIEALKTLTPNDSQTITEMQQWLLAQKHTQAWDTPINSVNAVYAFLNGQPKVLDAQENVAMKVDGKALALPKGTAGLGYVKTALKAEKPQTLTIEKRSQGTSWGAVYAQFTQKAANIKATGSGMTVKREYILPKGQTKLKVGDRLTVRITIQAERDYDFIEVVDRRAACLEPTTQLSGYHDGSYRVQKDFTTNYFFNGISKGRHVIESDYYVDRAGSYSTGSITVGCAYAPEFRATAPSQTLIVEE